MLFRGALAIAVAAAFMACGGAESGPDLYDPYDLQFDAEGHEWLCANASGLYISAPESSRLRFRYAVPDSLDAVPGVRKDMIVYYGSGDGIARVPMRSARLEASARQVMLPPAGVDTRYAVVLRGMVRVPATLPDGQELWSVAEKRVDIYPHP